MRTYLVSYDLLAPNRNYEDLYKAFKSYGSWARITESTWAVVTDQSAVEVHKYLGSFLDTDDRLFVLRSGTEAAWRNTRCRTEWLKKHL